jgi:hypothetical protein
MTVRARKPRRPPRGGPGENDGQERDKSTGQRPHAKPADVIERNYAKYVRLQREQQGAFNARRRDEFAKRGRVFDEVDQAASAD